MASKSPTPNPGESSEAAAARKRQTAADLQKQQLERLMKDPAKPVNIPAPPKEKELRAPREMMKNVQGSSAGAGSGEFHVYKQSRRREYERIKIMEDAAQKASTPCGNRSRLGFSNASLQEKDIAEFERLKREREEQSEAKTAKNRAKRQKKKNRAMGKGSQVNTEGTNEEPTKRRRLAADGAGVVFRRPGDASDDDDDDSNIPIPPRAVQEEPELPTLPPDVKIAEPTQIIIHDD